MRTLQGDCWDRIISITLLICTCLFSNAGISAPYLANLGVVTAYDSNNSQQLTFLMLLNSEYVAPVHLNGDTAYVSMLVYSNDYCEGQPYLTYSNQDPFIFPGVLVNSQNSNILYIPKTATRKKITAFSRRLLREGYATCNGIDENISVYETKSNDPSETNWYSFGARPIPEILKYFALGPENDWATTNLEEGFENDQETLYQEENFDDIFSETGELSGESYICPEFCEASFINDGVCDIMCNIAACGYDTLDCSVKDSDSITHSEFFDNLINDPNRRLRN